MCGTSISSKFLLILSEIPEIFKGKGVQGEGNLRTFM